MRHLIHFSFIILIVSLYVFLTSCSKEKPVEPPMPEISDSESYAEVAKGIQSTFQQLAKPSSKFENTLSYTLPGMDQVIVKHRVYRSHSSEVRASAGNDASAAAQHGPMVMDVYYPPDFKGNKTYTPVVFVMGFPDDAATSMMGAPLKNTSQYMNWGRLVAADGMAGITYLTKDPIDLDTVIEYLRHHAKDLKINPDNIGLWSCSNNPLTACSYMLQPGREHIKFAVFYYPLMYSPDRYMHDFLFFISDWAGNYYQDLPVPQFLRDDVEMLFVRCGNDFPEINLTLDHFLNLADEQEIDYTLLEYKDGIHGFDELQHTSESREILKQTIEFMQANAF